jgi:hypothetical protein
VVHVPLGVRENNIGNGGKQKKGGLKQKHKNKVMKFWFTKRDLCESCHKTRPQLVTIILMLFLFVLILC